MFFLSTFTNDVFSGMTNYGL